MPSINSNRIRAIIIFQQDCKVFLGHCSCCFRHLHFTIWPMSILKKNMDRKIVISHFLGMIRRTMRFLLFAKQEIFLMKLWLMSRNNWINSIKPIDYYWFKIMSKVTPIICRIHPSNKTPKNSSNRSVKVVNRFNSLIGRGNIWTITRVFGFSLNVRSVWDSSLIIKLTRSPPNQNLN